VLGVTDDTHEFVGTKAFHENWNELSNKIFNNLNMRVDVEEYINDGKRALIFHAPKHSPGLPIKYLGRYRIRNGESITNMDEQTLQKIFAEVAPDYSMSVVDGFTIDDLDDTAVQNFRKERSKKLENSKPDSEPIERLLSDTGLMKGAGLTFACLVLLGKEEKIRGLAPQAEIIYEWRSNKSQNHHDFRVSWRKPYFAIYEEVWEVINARNIRTPFQEGFIQNEIYAFDEKVCREVVNNAVAHRDYSIIAASVFIHASPEKIAVTSPGSLPQGVTLENILNKSQWRNRTIADAMEHTKLVERSGQGMNDIFEISIRHGKGTPDFTGTDNYQVKINIPAIVQDVNFVRFLEKMYSEKQEEFSFDELLELENMRKGGTIKNLDFKDKFLRLGIVERVGKTSGTKYMLSRRYYEHEGRAGVYSGIRGLSRESKKQLIIEHLQKGPAHVQEFVDAFPDLKRTDVNNLLQELKNDKKIYFTGKTRSKTGVWELVRNIKN
jgi:ATP-dependent DNA helicase RecG